MTKRYTYNSCWITGAQVRPGSCPVPTSPTLISTLLPIFMLEIWTCLKTAFCENIPTLVYVGSLRLLLSHQVDCMCLRDSALLRFFWQLYRRKKNWQQHLDAHAGQILTVCPLALTQSKPEKLSRELHHPPCIQT